MAKTILIPTDFRVESLNTLKFALSEQDCPVNVILLYGNFLTDSITELLFYSPHKIISSRMEPQFQQGLDIIRNRFARDISCVRIELLNAYSLPLLKNILGQHHVDMIYIPKTYRLKPAKRGFDPVPLLKRAQVTIAEIDWDSQGLSNDLDQLQALFARKN